MNNLPQGWTNPTIGTLCQLINGRAFKPTEWTNTGLPIVRIQNLNDPTAAFNRFAGEVRDRFLINTGDLLFAWSGTPGTSFGAHIWSGGPAVLNQHIFKVVFNQRAIDKRFLQLAINQKLGELIHKAHGGVGLRHVTKGRFEDTEVVLPPYAEQRLIVAKLDSLFKHSKGAREELSHIPRLVERCKQTILAAAFEGDLTSQGRATTTSGAASLLKELGITPLPNSDLPEIPSTWQWVRAGDLCSIKGGIALGKKRQPGATLVERPYLRVANVQRGWLNLSEIKNVLLTEKEAAALRLQPGDVLMNEGGGQRQTWKGLGMGRTDRRLCTSEPCVSTAAEKRQRSISLHLLLRQRVWTKILLARRKANNQPRIDQHVQALRLANTDRGTGRNEMHSRKDRVPFRYDGPALC